MNNKIKMGLVLLIFAAALTFAAQPSHYQVEGQQAHAQGEISDMPGSPFEGYRERTYQIRKGDRLWLIAERFYGDGHLWHKIAEANGISNPNAIYPGQVIIIPQ